MHIAEMYNRSDAEEFSNSLAIMDKHLAEKFARYAFPVMPSPLYLPFFMVYFVDCLRLSIRLANLSRGNSQARLYRHQGLRPQLHVQHVSARLLYSLITFKEIEPDYSG